MVKERRIFTSESVTEGHPDKVCDQISDAILDDILAQDPSAHVACEVCATTGLVMVMGEITTTGYCDVQKIVRETVANIGYNRGKIGFDAENLAVLVSLDSQSPDIAMGVKDGDGAGDQGMMFGYACKETPEYMPLPIMLAHKLAKRLADLRKLEGHNELRPDGKTQVSVEYDEQNNPVRIDTIVISTQHNEEVSQEYLRDLMITEVINKVIDAKLMDENTRIFINPTGRFVIGGPKGDTGLTGRKIIVDTYGGYAPHGGGAFSGKDPTKVDRSACYAARYVAKNLVAAGFAERVQIQLSYAIGVAEPTSICIDTFGTSKYTEFELIKIVRENFDLTPKGIITSLNLRQPIYKQTAAYGHFGRTDVLLPWEQLDKVDDLKKYLNK
ncbi:MAG: methionine adenosyltransferase [Erysipelotrichaceae bacterium]|nr:methionine adenosyltransferase [Erysipelotrichaceae bacterium]